MVLHSMAVDTDIGTNSRPPGSEPCDQTPDKSKPFLPLFIRFERRIYAYIFTLVPQRADADDLLQETSLVMWDKFDVASPPNDFLAWARRIAYHKVLDFYKKSRRSQARLSQIFLERISESAIEANSATPLEDRREALAACVEKLSPRGRELLTHRFTEGATTQSTAERIGLSVEAAYKALAKVRQLLFDCVQKRILRENQA
jgi:RNA polymerase sigma-70 factor (ECF subfamily)